MVGGYIKSILPMGLLICREPGLFLNFSFCPIRSPYVHISSLTNTFIEPLPRKRTDLKSEFQRLVRAQCHLCHLGTLWPWQVINSSEPQSLPLWPRDSNSSTWLGLATVKWETVEVFVRSAHSQSPSPFERTKFVSRGQVNLLSSALPNLIRQSP